MLRNNLGILFLAGGRPRDAQQAIHQACRLREALVADFPSVPSYRQEWAASLDSLGSLETNLGDFPQAEEHLQKALRLQEEVARDIPGLAMAQRELAVGYV